MLIIAVGKLLAAKSRYMPVSDSNYLIVGGDQVVVDGRRMNGWTIVVG